MNIIKMRNKIRELWEQCCNHENIPLDAQFVVFSNDNPYLPEYNKYVRILLAYHKTISKQILNNF